MEAPNRLIIARSRHHRRMAERHND